jgi:hypothetical protein
MTGIVPSRGHDFGDRTHMSRGWPVSADVRPRRGHRSVADGCGGSRLLEATANLRLVRGPGEGLATAETRSGAIAGLGFVPGN